MSIATEIHEKIVARKIRGETVRSQVVDHEEFLELWWSIRSHTPGSKLPLSPGRFDQMIFEGVYILNGG